MPQDSFDTLAETRELEQAGCPTLQAEAIVRTVARGASLNMSIIKDIAELKAHVEVNMASQADLVALRAHVEENVVTKSHLAETLDQFELKRVVTKDQLTEALTAIRDEMASFRAEMLQSFAQLYRHLLAGALGLAGVIIGFVKFV